MIQKTGKIAWLEIRSEALKHDVLSQVPMIGDYVLCEEHKDIQTGKITWTPVKLIRDGEVKL